MKLLRFVIRKTASRDDGTRACARCRVAKFQSRAYSCALIDRENCERSNGGETTLSALPISLRAAGWYSFHASANSLRGCYRNLSERKGKERKG